MDSDSDDLYDPADATPAGNDVRLEHRHAEVKMEDVDDGEEEEGEEVEEDDSDDDDINFITDQKEEPKLEAPPQAKRQPSIVTSSVDPRKASTTPVPGLKSEGISDSKPSPQSSNERPGTDYPAHHTSTLDPNGNPVHPTTGKPILSTDFDNDFPSESTKPWRKPGSDITDYFNYGFDEFTWASYCLKQQQMPKEITEINKQAEQMRAFVEGIPGGGMPGMPGLPGAQAAAPTAAVPTMPGMPSEAEMQQMLQGMMAQGVDPSTMDQNQFMQMMMMGGGGGGQAFGGQGQGFNSGQGPGQQAQAGYGGGGGGFDQGGNFGGGRGRGRGGRRNW